MYKIYLSPSNNSKLFGVNNFGSEEFRMRQIAEIVKSNLISTGNYAVYITESDMDKDEVIQKVNQINPNLYISINVEEKDIRGIKCYTKDTEPKSNGFAKEIYKSLQKIYYDKEIDNGIIYNLNIKEISKINSPVVVVCVGSRSDVKDADWITENITKIGEKISEGIQKGFTLKSC